METIKINEIDKKDSGLVIIKHSDGKEATMNTKWQEQEVDYIEKDVGIGGSVSVLIVQKGEYTNITKIDMTSAVKGTAPIPKPTEQTTVGLMSVKDIQIISQCLTKAWVQTSKEPGEILDSYRFFVKELEENG